MLIPSSADEGDTPLVFLGSLDRGIQSECFFPILKVDLRFPRQCYPAAFGIEVIFINFDGGGLDPGAVLALHTRFTEP